MNRILPQEARHAALRKILATKERLTISEIAKGNPQKAIWQPGMLDVEGVVYVLLNMKTHRIYTRLSINSAFKRFQQHWSKQNIPNRAIARAMKNSKGKYEWTIIPMVKIERSTYIKQRKAHGRGHTKESIDSFHRASAPLEAKCMEQLKSGIQSGGLNTQTYKKATKHAANHRAPYRIRKPQEHQQKKQLAKQRGKVHANRWLKDTMEGNEEEEDDYSLPQQSTRYKTKPYCKDEKGKYYMREPNEGEGWEKKDIRIIRRLKHLLEAYNNGATPAALENIEAWSTNCVVDTKLWMYENIPYEERQGPLKDIERKLIQVASHGWEEHSRTNKSILAPTRRKTEVEKKINQRRPFIIMAHIHKETQKTAIRKIIQEIATSYPNPEEGKRILICDRLNIPIGRIIGNFTTEAIHLENNYPQQNTTKMQEDEDTLLAQEDNQELQPTCKCLLLWKDPQEHEIVQGHIVTQEYDKINNNIIRSALISGSKFRHQGDPHEVMATLEQGIQQYIDWRSRARG